jgi:hypothetical protein
MVMESSIFWDIYELYSPSEVSRRFGGTCHLQQGQRATYFMLVSYLAYSSTLKMEETCSSETSVDFQRATRQYITEYRTLQNISTPLDRLEILFEKFSQVRR